MNYNNNLINNLIEQEITFVDIISKKHSYPDNISHLLYIIIPAFILKYGTNNKKLIEECFSNIPILINDKQDKIYQAYYFSKPIIVKDEIITQKGIVLKNYKNISLMQLLDNLIHEFNHAINSMNKEIKQEKYLLVRTGITLNYFDTKTLTFIKQSNERILEEVINTKQTEMIIDIIKSLSNYNITNTIVTNTLYSINHSITSNYKSNSYLLETLICKKLLENKTFISTLEILRLEGNIEDIHDFFDSITGTKDSLITLSQYLSKILKLQKEYTETKLFKNFKLNKLKEINQKALEIVNKFNENTVYK